MPEVDIQVNDTDPVDWNCFLNESTPDIYNIYQTYEWANLQKNVNGYTPFFVRVKEGSELLGQQLYFKKRTYGVFNAYSSVGGPICPEGQTVATEKLLISHLLSEKQNSLYIRIRPRTFPGLEEEFTKKGFTRMPVFYFLVDLDRDEEDLWKGLKKNARKKINKAERSGVIIENAKEWSLWLDFYKIYAQHSVRKKLDFESLNFFKDLYEKFMPKGMAELFVALYDGSVISGVILLCNDRIMSSYISAHDEKYETYASKDLVFWSALLWGRSKGILIYHTDDTFPDPKSPQYGIHKFKEKWGGQLTEGSIYYYGRSYLLGKELTKSKKNIMRKLNEVKKGNQILIKTKTLENIQNLSSIVHR